jgi:DNA repair exonuclease SbcCD nuclease subunit
MKFIHAADLHLGASFQGIREISPVVSDSLQNASYTAFRRIIDFGIDKDVDFILIAGDIFDNSHSPLRPLLKFGEQIERLDKAGIPSFILRGNHDPLGEDEIAFKLPLSCHVFPQKPSEPVTVYSRLGEPLASVSGMSYPKREFRENVSKKLKPSSEGLFSIALHHGNCGDSDHAPYAPFTLSDLRESGFDYWALGHIHKPQVLIESHPVAIYAGSAQGLNPKETGDRGCWLVEVDASRNISYEFVSASPVLWREEDVAADDWENMSQAVSALDRLFEQVSNEAPDKSILLRIKIQGQSPIDKTLKDSANRLDLVNHINERIKSDSRNFVFIEQLEIDTAPPIDIEQIRDSKMIEGEIVRLADDASAPGVYQDELLADIKEIFVKARRAGAKLATECESQDSINDKLQKARNMALAKLMQG